ncbi:MAG: hypothetical protein EOR51_22560 [Mesorhizobium sp.]|nr:MAG: hypothetical protein EOR51_22560 [Mesorhizobium sp.]
MKSVLLGACLALSLSSTAPAQTFDWSGHLGKPFADLEAALGKAAQCDRGGFSIPVKWVGLDTTLEDDLYDPVRTNDFAPITLSGPVDLSSDRDEERFFKVDRVSYLTCVLGREATATAYAADDLVVRINIEYDRCESRAKRKPFGFQDTTFEFFACEGVDMTEKNFDTALYQSIKARGKPGYNKQGDPGMLNFAWSGSAHGAFAATERRTMVDFGCDIRGEASRQLPPSVMKYRCLIDVENGDPSRWSATAMYEIFSPGIVFDDVSTRLTARRLFIDMPAEQAAAAAIRPELQAMIDGIKTQISDRKAQKASDDGAVSNVLGAGN